MKKEEKITWDCLLHGNVVKHDFFIVWQIRYHDKSFTNYKYLHLYILGKGTMGNGTRYPLGIGTLILWETGNYILWESGIGESVFNPRYIDVSITQRTCTKSLECRVYIRRRFSNKNQAAYIHIYFKSIRFSSKF